MIVANAPGVEFICALSFQETQLKPHDFYI